MSANKNDSFVLTKQAVLSIFGVTASFPNPEDDHPGPWGPVVRRAEERARAVLGSSPEPGREVFGPGPDPWRAAFAQALAEEAVDRANLMQQVADALPQTGSKHAIIIIGGMLQDFVDGCGTGRIKQHFPPPRHHDGARLNPFQLVLISAQLQSAANATSNEGMRQEFTKASEQLLQAAIRHLPSAVSQAAA